MSAIDCAFFAALCRPAENRVARNGAPFLKFDCRVGDDGDPMFVTVRTFDVRTVDQVSRFVAGALIYVEGKLSVTKRTGTDGRPKADVDVKAWHIRISEIGRRRAKRDPVHTAVDLGEAAP